VTGRVYVVLGATGGIGSAVCRRLAARGGRLLLAARNSERLTALAESTGGVPLSMDATRAEDVDRLFAHALQKYDRVDGVAHLVGNILLKPAHTTTDQEWHDTIACNLHSAFYTLRAAARAMQSAGGSIVFASSAAARLGLANHDAIAAAKAGIVGLTQSAAASYAQRGLRVNAVAPGLVRTPGAARLTGNELALKASTAMHALGRIGEPDDVASAVEFLLDPAHSWITGQVFGIDGGLSSVRSR
jgi:NAD(P)-dependent dehydrogenase (short-subunit alcohol dehydrogenase family)